MEGDEKDISLKSVFSIPEEEKSWPRFKMQGGGERGLGEGQFVTFAKQHEETSRH